MNDRRSPAFRHALLGAAPVFAALLAASLSCTPAYADVFGRIHVVVTSADGKPVSGAAVIFHDPTGVRGDVTATTDAQGAALSPLLENHTWQVTTTRPGFQTDTRPITVQADTSDDVTVSLLASVINTGTSRIIGTHSATVNSTRRDLGFLLKIPATAGNPQSLPRLLVTNPGFVQSSVNSVHPRGEHASTSIYIDGFLLPGVLQGRAGPQLDPDIIQSADIQTGGYAPEYGSETAAILNLSLRAGLIKPFQQFNLDSGSFQTLDQELTVGGQGGAPLLSGDGGPDAPRKFRYLVNVSGRSTDNALEAPQPDNQDMHNEGISKTFFGNFDYLPSSRDQFTLLLNSAPANTQIANRTGLPSKYAPIGQGYGYGGARDADGTEPGADPNSVGGQTLVLPSQQSAGQDVYQGDDNAFGALNYRHTFNPHLTGLVSVGVTRSILDIVNRNPSIDLNSLNPDGTLTTIDNSIEYNPTILRNSTQKQVAASLTQAQGTHTYKAGFTLTGQTGDEYYQFVPQSQLALDSLAAVQTGGPQLTPNGTLQVDAQGNPVLDALGNQVYLITPGATTPTVQVHRSGYYNAGYLQDTWRATRRLTANYGLRLDNYGQKQMIGGSTTTTNETYLSPRLNLAYTLGGGTTGRLSYNKLFTQPPLAEGAIVGTPLKPQITDAYEADLERQLAPNQTAKLSYYYKNDHNQNDTGILIPFTQIGAYTTLQYQHASIHGVEVSYTLTPRNNVGLGGYVSYAHSHARPGGLDQTGAPAPTVNDHDQSDTVSTGFDYTLRSQAFAGIDFTYGSGEASSVLAPISPSNSNVLSGGSRISHTEVDLRLGSPKIAGYGGLELDVQNLFNSLSVLNFNSGFSGTRFQQGRRILLRATGSF